MTDVSMEIQYLRQDGTLTYEGATLFRDLIDGIDDLAGATVALDNLTDVTITTPASGQALTYNGSAWVNSVAGVRVLLATRTASASATLDFTEFSNSVYRRYEFELEDVKPATDATGLLVRFSTNGGSSYDAGASDYAWASHGNGGASPTGTSNNATTSILLTFTNNVGNAAAEFGVTGLLDLFHAADATKNTRAHFAGSYENTAGDIVIWSSAGRRKAAQDTDALRFLYSSGNIASGTIRMFGIA